MNSLNRDMVLNQISLLLQTECFDSAEVLCSMYLSTLSTSKSVQSKSSLLYPEALELYGDIIFKKSQPRRALFYYKQALQQRQYIAAFGRKSQSLQVVTIETPADCQLLSKQCLCHLELKDNQSAMKDLEVIPPNLRDVKVNLTLGMLYKGSNLNKQAIASYVKVVESMPMCLEAIEALVLLGMETNDLLSLLDRVLRDRPEAIICEDGWLHSLATSLVMKRNHDFKKCEIQLSRLLVTYPKCLYFLTIVGTVTMNREQSTTAIAYFKQIRRCDSLFVDGMDQFGLLLARNGNETELSSLTQDILNISSDRPEGWLLLASFSEMKGELEKSIQFVDKVTAV